MRTHCCAFCFARVRLSWPTLNTCTHLTIQKMDHEKPSYFDVVLEPLDHGQRSKTGRKTGKAYLEVDHKLVAEIRFPSCWEPDLRSQNDFVPRTRAQVWE